MDERAAARKATNGAYALRVCGMDPNSENRRYVGDFDYLVVANAAPIPGPGNYDHAWHWQQMWDLFDEEWAKYKEQVA